MTCILSTAGGAVGIFAYVINNGGNTMPKGIYKAKRSSITRQERRYN